MKSQNLARHFKYASSLRVTHRKLPSQDGGYLGRDIWQSFLRFQPSPVTLSLHLHYLADPPYPKKNLKSRFGGESDQREKKFQSSHCVGPNSNSLFY